MINEFKEFQRALAKEMDGIDLGSGKHPDAVERLFRINDQAFILGLMVSEFYSEFPKPYTPEY